jgi:class 3 adenylate cyclase
MERRIVTVLFADLVGFTPLSERLDAEDVGTIQDAYFGAVLETIGRYGGQLEKFIGDAAMAVFGLPRTRDDDAERAVRAGLALVHAIDALAGRIGLETSELQVRVGINTGEVVTSEASPGSATQGDGSADGRVTGDAVNTAARLQTAAPPGRVLLGETTALAVADSIELEAVGPVVLKGKAAPVQASLAVGARPARSRELAMGSLHAPLVGRAADLARLHLAADGARVGAAEGLLLVAPPGVGKSRLVEEFVRQLDGFAVLRARLPAEAPSPFGAIATLLWSVPGFDPSDRRSLVDRLERAGVSRGRAEVVADDIVRLVAPGTQQAGRPADR